MSRKIIIIGIDGASLDLILPRIEQYNLRNFKRLLQEGTYGLLRSTFIANSASAWTTFMTGKNPGKHGIYDFFNAEHYSPKCVYFSDVEDKPFWDVLATKGRKSYIINVPLTYPPKIDNGVLISGLQTPPDKKDFIYPGDFWSEVRKVSPEYKVFPSADPKKDLRAHIKEIDMVLNSQMKLVLHILKRQSWDLICYVVQNTDTLQHYLWNYIDKTHSRYKYDVILNKALFELYKKIDEFIGCIIESMDDDTCLMVMSDHGAGKVEKHFLVNNWLLQNKFLSLKNNIATDFKKFMMRFGVCDADLHNFFIAGNPLNTLGVGRKRKRRDRVFYKMNDIDWSRTKAYGMNVNQLFINLKDRESQGIINAKDDYASLTNELIEKLKKIKHPYKNKPLIDKIYKKDDIFFGEKMHKMPDIIFICDEFEIISPGGYKVASPHIFDNLSWTGDHRLHGMLLCYGKNIKKNTKIEGANIEDVPSTVMALLEGMVPEDFDGKVLSDIFLDKRFENVKKESILTKKEAKNNIYQDDEKIKAVLESLGYL